MTHLKPASVCSLFGFIAVLGGGVNALPTREPLFAQIAPFNPVVPYPANVVEDPNWLIATSGFCSNLNVVMKERDVEASETEGNMAGHFVADISFNYYPQTSVKFTDFPYHQANTIEGDQTEADGLLSPVWDYRNIALLEPTSTCSSADEQIEQWGISVFKVEEHRACTVDETAWEDHPCVHYTGYVSAETSNFVNVNEGRFVCQLFVDSGPTTRANAAKVTKTKIPSDMGGSIQNYCQHSVCDGSGTQWHLLGDPEVTDNPPNQAWVEAHPDQISWSGLERPTVTEEDLKVDCDNTGNSDQMTCNAQIAVQYGLTMTTSTTTGSKIGLEFSVEASIPEVVKVGAKTSFEVSTTETSSRAASQAETITLTAIVPVEAGKRKCAYVKQKMSSYESTWTLPMSITGGVRCQYDSPCRNHYYWFGRLNDVADNSYMISGKSTAKVMSYGAVQTRDGAC